jgi:hypothetical protein
MQSYRKIKEIGTTCIKDTCLRIPLAVAQGIQSRCLGNSPRARSLLEDRQAGNKQWNKINKTELQTNDYQQYDAMDR